jgi:antitoxin component YwqK of YwqJK toxin-antitoxin module
MPDVEIKGFAFSPKVMGDYVGEAEDGVPNGFGKPYLTNGLIYEGQWKKGKLHGKGKQYYPEGNLEYEGEYVYGHREGFGKSYLRDGRLKYEGIWMFGEEANMGSTRTNWA